MIETFSISIWDTEIEPNTHVVSFSYWFSENMCDDQPTTCHVNLHNQSNSNNFVMHRLLISVLFYSNIIIDAQSRSINCRFVGDEHDREGRDTINRTIRVHITFSSSVKHALCADLCGSMCSALAPFPLHHICATFPFNVGPPAFSIALQSSMEWWIDPVSHTCLLSPQFTICIFLALDNMVI